MKIKDKLLEASQDQHTIRELATLCNCSYNTAYITVMRNKLPFKKDIIFKGGRPLKYHTDEERKQAINLYGKHYGKHRPGYHKEYYTKNKERICEQRREKTRLAKKYKELVQQGIITDDTI